METPPNSTATSLYRYYDEQNVLIYVGITKTGIQRNRQHNHDKAWWPYVASQQVDHFESLDTAHAREIDLIQTFRPPFNKQHNHEHRDIHAAYIAARHAGLYEINHATLLPPELRRLDLTVRWIKPDEGRCELWTRVEHGAAVMRLVFTPDRPLNNRRGRMIGKITAIYKHGPVARIAVTMKRHWNFSQVEMYLRPMNGKGPVKYEVKQLIATDAANDHAPEAKTEC